MLPERYIIADFGRSTLPSFYDDPESFISVWSPAELKLLGRISPLSVQKLNNALGTSFPFEPDGMIGYAKSLMPGLLFKTDNTLFQGKLTPDIVGRKLRHHCKLHQSLGEAPPLQDIAIDRDTMRDCLYEIKRDALEVAGRFARSSASAVLETCEAPPFVPPLAQLFGANLDGIVQYGSSLNGGGRDIDLLVFLKRFDCCAYAAIDGKYAAVPSEKPLGIVLLPADGLEVVSGCDDHGYVMANGGGRVVFGPARRIPVQSPEEYVDGGYAAVGAHLTSLRGALGDRARQQVMASQRGQKLLESALKDEYWIRKGLLQRELGRPLGKEEVLQHEEIHDLVLDNISIDGVKSVLYDANCRVKERVKAHLDRI